MTDLSQPATPAEFIGAGASPEQAAILVEQHEAMCGRRGPDARAALSIGMRDQPPAPTPAPATRSVTQAEATASLEAHTQAQLSAHLADAFAPPASPSDYRFPPTGRDATDEEFAQDNAIKSAFHSEGVPRWLGEGVVKSLVEGEHALERLTPEQGQARIVSTESSLKRMWGKDYEGNLATVDNLLEQMARKNPGLGIDGTVRLNDGRDVPLLELLDSLTIDSLLQFAKHRAGSRR